MDTTMMTSTTTAAPAAKVERFVGKCKACGKGRKHEGAESYRTVRTFNARVGRHVSTTSRFFGGVEASEGGSGYDVIVPCACGKFVRCKRVYAHGSCDAKCSGTCTHAKGPACDCSCQGKNHGGGL